MKAMLELIGLRRHVLRKLLKQACFVDQEIPITTPKQVPSKGYGHLEKVVASYSQ
jgi:hypothetical protein